LDQLDSKIGLQRKLVSAITPDTAGAERDTLLVEKHENAQWLLKQLTNLAKNLEMELKVDATSTFSAEVRPSRELTVLTD